MKRGTVNEIRKRERPRIAYENIAYRKVEYI